MKDIGVEEAKIFDAHKEMLDDSELISQVEAYIKDQSCSALYAIKEVGAQFEMIFKSMANDYMRERAADIKDIAKRMINHGLGIDMNQMSPNKPCVVLAHDLTPSMTSSFDPAYVEGIITEVGGKTSHSAIIANMMGIPYVVLDGAMSLIDADIEVLFDGSEGLIITQANEMQIAEYSKRKSELEAEQERYASLAGKPSQTLDGQMVTLLGNLGKINDLVHTVEGDVEGIGLFRTEFLFMEETDIPNESRQFDVYKELAQAFEGGSVTIRTLDIGGDKTSPHIDLPKEDNPFLGYRGIRLCLGSKDLFKTQLRAILKASAYGTIKIMYPMIASLTELHEANQLLDECKQDLDQQSIDYDKEIQVGMMIETPASIMMADHFAKAVDFFSVGTNDLVQYTLAADRMNPSLDYLYSAYDPAVLNSVRIAAKAAKEHNIPISICGESAADPKLLPIWVGIGIDKLSMTVTSAPAVKWALSRIDSSEAKCLTDKVCRMSTKQEVMEALS